VLGQTFLFPTVSISLVRLNDLGYKPVTNYIRLLKLNKLNALDSLKQAEYIQQTRVYLLRQVYLG
jgi:hypothetical protein